ncbi:MAG: GHMP family kinase ATP-binding protein [Solirubrobacteraceae bacterium]
MLITRAPVRISFAGGGTDLASYYERHGGLVVSATIDKYFYVFANAIEADSVQISSSDYRAFFRAGREQPLWDDDMSLPRTLLREFGIDAGISLFLASEIPPGTGLGSSSTVCVALAKALGALRGLAMTKAQIAEVASRIEIDELGMPIGRQDQYASAFGGLNVIRFAPDGVEVEPLDLPMDVVRALERRALLFFTGSSRSAASILEQQRSATQRGDADVLARLHRIKEIALEVVELLRAGDVDALGPLLDRSWREKRGIAPAISNEGIDRWYRLAKENGATGGKILGAGGGGFMLAFTPEEAQPAVTAALEAEGLLHVDYSFESGGAVVLMNALPGLPADDRMAISIGASE